MEMPRKYGKDDPEMKKVLSLVLALLLALSLAGCAGSKPETVVTAFCGAIQAFDLEKAAACMENGSADLEDPYDDAQAEGSLSSAQIMDYLKECASEMTYGITESKTDGDRAEVSVSFTYVDAGPVMSAALGEYITQAFALAFSGADDAQMEELFGSIFMEKTESVETGTASADVTFNCVKVNGDWKIASFTDEAEEAITEILTSRVAGTLEGFGQAFEEEASEEEPETTVWHDVPPGQDAELATLRIRITGCEEKNELTAEYFDPEPAQEGTKFVVFSVVAENITNESINFNNDLVLTDSQGRSYNPYTDALWYYDETFCYTDLAPSIAKSGVFVYNVPADSDGYFLSVLKAGTGDGYRLYAK